MHKAQRRSLSHPFLFSCFLAFLGAGGGMNMKKPQQGLSGTFSTYGPPSVRIDCGPLVTQADTGSKPYADSAQANR